MSDVSSPRSLSVFPFQAIANVMLLQYVNLTELITVLETNDTFSPYKEIFTISYI